MPQVTWTHSELFVACKVCVDLSPCGELFVAHDVGEDLAASGHGELFVAHDDCDITQRTPSGFATTQLTPSGFAATCYPTLDTTQNTTTSSGCRKVYRTLLVYLC